MSPSDFWTDILLGIGAGGFIVAGIFAWVALKVWQDHKAKEFKQ